MKATLFRTALGLLLALCANQAAMGHDFWIEPSSYRPEIGSSVRLALRVGEDFSGRAIPRSSGHIDRFVASGPRGEQAVPGLEGRDPAGFVRVDARGTYTVTYQSHRSAITLEGARFEKYLAAEGLDSVLEKRRQRGESAAAGREVFSRCAKTTLRTAGGDVGSKPAAALAPASTGSAPVEPHDASIGCPFELFVEDDRGTPSLDANNSVLALYRGQPLAGVRVVALTGGPDGRHLTARTGPDGKVQFNLDSVGPWLVKAVHMVEAPDEVDSDWESLWASVTFEVTSKAGVR